jgi:hypothetical protein
LKIAAKLLFLNARNARRFEKKRSEINAAAWTHAPQQRTSLFDHLVGAG